MKIKQITLQNILPEFPLKSYYKFAKTHFDYTQFPDLVELHDLLESKIVAQ
jgi:hypothetical protein